MIVMPVSSEPKPKPFTVIKVPGEAFIWLRVMVGLTVNVMPVREPGRVTEPEAFIMWEPEADAGTVKVLLQLPWELAEMPEATRVAS
jgi:hypothetical protein